MRFEPQIRPSRLAINFLFINTRTERKVCLCVKLFDFFRGRILIRFTWNLSIFVSNSVEMLTWNFRKKLCRENFSKFLCKPRLSSTETCEISPYFLKFYSESVLRWKNSHKYFHMLFVPMYGGTSIIKSPKEYTVEKNQDLLFSENLFCSASVWNLLHLTHSVFWSEIFTRRSSPCLLIFGWDLSPRFVPQDWQ